MLKPDNIHWSKNKICSYNALFNFVVGARGTGKTWALKYYCVQQYIKHESKFMYIMRYNTELEQATSKGKFFADLLNYFDNFRFKTDGNSGYIKYVPDGADEKKIDWELLCYFKSMSEMSIKAISDPNIKTIIFDEFVPNPGVRYIKNEVERFLELYFTISRGVRDTKVYFLANNITSANPYFVYFGLTLPNQGECVFKNDICIENVKNIKFAETMKNTRFGKMINGTDYAKYAIDNETYIDETSFIVKMPDKAVCVVRLLTKYGTLYLWTSKAMLIVSDKGNPNSLTWSCDEESKAENIEQIDYASSYAKKLIQNYNRFSTLFYTSPVVKSKFLQACQKILK